LTDILISTIGLHFLYSVQSAQLLTKNNRVVDIFIVSDAETRAAIPEDRWPDIKEKIFAKLKRRNVLNAATGDPKLVEQVIKLLYSCFERYTEVLHFSCEMSNLSEKWFCKQPTEDVIKVIEYYDDWQDWQV